jgi:hypothetical protein
VTASPIVSGGAASSSSSRQRPSSTPTKGKLLGSHCTHVMSFSTRNLTLPPDLKSSNASKPRPPTSPVTKTVPPINLKSSKSSVANQFNIVVTQMRAKLVYANAAPLTLTHAHTQLEKKTPPPPPLPGPLHRYFQSQAIPNPTHLPPKSPAKPPQSPPKSPAKPSQCPPLMPPEALRLQ